jgi:hypothetical protein
MVMPQSLDYETATLPWWQQPRARSHRVATAAFVIPPAAISVAWLLTRIAIHYSHWGAVPLFMLVLVACGGACLMLAGWFAVGYPAGRSVFRFLAWVVCSAACAWAGLALIDLLPITVGDGP